jgi:hypothetical protein
MKIELLYFDGCPSHEAFLPRLGALIAHAGIVDAEVRERRVESDAGAQRERFLGSPTLRVDGRDVDPGAGERTDFGMRCRAVSDRRGAAGCAARRVGARRIAARRRATVSGR